MVVVWREAVEGVRCVAQWLVAITAGLSSCVSEPFELSPASVAIEPGSAVLSALGDTAVFRATVYDGSGAAISGYSVNWSVAVGTVATVSDGVAVARGNGSPSSWRSPRAPWWHTDATPSRTR